MAWTLEGGTKNGDCVNFCIWFLTQPEWGYCRLGDELHLECGLCGGCTDRSKTWPFLPEPSCRPDNVARTRTNLRLPAKGSEFKWSDHGQKHSARFSLPPAGLLHCGTTVPSSVQSFHHGPSEPAEPEVSRGNTNGPNNCLTKPTIVSKKTSSLFELFRRQRLNVRINYNGHRGKEVGLVPIKVMDRLSKVVFYNGRKANIK